MSISERGDLDRTTTTTTNRILEQFKSELDKAGWMNIYRGDWNMGKISK